MRKFAIILLLITFVIFGCFIYAFKRADVHHYPERRDWKNRAISAVRADLKDPSIYRVEDGKLLRPESEFLSEAGSWYTRKAIAFWDSSWIVYRQQCQKSDPKIHDIFIGRGSDGKWYYSDDHFCIDAMVLNMRGQPDSITEFKKAFELKEFDGSSDQALESTTERP